MPNFVARSLYTACPLCNSSDIRPMLTADCSGHALYHPAIPPKMTWLKCAACEHVFTDGYYTEDALNLLFELTHENQKIGFDMENQRAISARIIEKVLPYVQTGDWLDVGFGNGSLLITAAEYGFVPIGIDLRKPNVDGMRSFGIEAHCVDIGEMNQSARFSVVSLADVLEHMPYPVKSLEIVHGLLRRGGMLFLSMPNMDSILWKALDQNHANPYWGELEHYHNFGRKRLFKLLRDSKFEPIRFGISERYRACMEVVARKKGKTVFGRSGNFNPMAEEDGQRKHSVMSSGFASPQMEENSIPFAIGSNAGSARQSSVPNRDTQPSAASASELDSADVLNDRGYKLQQQRRYEQALVCYDRALAVQPDHVHALNNRGNALFDLKRHEEALASYDRALAANPDYADAFNNRGCVLLNLRRYEEALASLNRAIALRPDYPVALNNLGYTQEVLRKYDQALTSFERALALDPNYVEALNNCGNTLLDLKRPAEALTRYDRALDLMPDCADALHNRGSALVELGRYSEAAQSFARLASVAPDHDYPSGKALDCQLRGCDWTNYVRAVAQIEAAVANGKRAAFPFFFLSVSSSAANQLHCARTYVSDKYPACYPPMWTGERYRHEKIRIAYLSADFHEHATAYLMAELFETHDSGRFETTAVSFGPEGRNNMRDRLERSFQRFLEVRSRSDREVAQMLRELEIDIAIDLKAFTADGRVGILAYRPAPVQVNYLGYPGTMGADYIDYLIADRHVIPPEHQVYYSEKVVRLPDTYQVNDSKRRIAERTPGRVDLGLPETGFVFCCFNNNYKIAPQVFDVWMRLLRKVEGSVLWLLGDNAATSDNLRREAEKRDVAPGRLIFARRMKLDEHLARHKRADLFLDTLPYNAHTTTSDALWTGLPVLTCMGSTFAGRVAGSLLNAIGLPELITHSLDEYQALALKLAAAPEFLAEIRAKLASNRATYPLFDTDRFRRHLESAYITMWERYQRGQPPEAFSVPPL